MTYTFSAVFHSQTIQRMVIVRTVIGTGRAKYLSKAHLKLVAPAIVNRTVMPRRPPNADLRTREHLTEVEVERLMDAARKNRWGHRDATMVLVAYRHGFRPAELVDLRWDQIDFASGRCFGDPLPWSCKGDLPSSAMFGNVSVNGNRG